MKLVRYLGLIGLAIFVFIVYSIGPVQIIESFLSLNPLIFLFALLILIPSISIKAWRQCLLVNVFGPKLGLFDSAKIWLIGFFFSVITPGKSGNLIKSFYFKKKPGISAGKGLSVVVVERFFDIVILLLFVIFGLAGISFYFIPGVDLFLLLLFLFASLVLLAFLSTKKNVVLFFARPVYNYLVPKRFGSKLKAGFHQFFEGLEVFKSKKGLMFNVAALTTLSWIVAIAFCYMLALSLHMNISFSYLFMVIPVVNLLSVLPIAFSGIGTREAALVFFLGLIGISASLAVSFSLLIFFTDLLFGFIGWLLIAGQKRGGF